MKPQQKIITSLVLIIIPTTINFLLDLFEVNKLMGNINLLAVLSLIGLIVVLQYILTQSNFKRSMYQKIFYIGYAILFLGFLFKLQHWSKAGNFLLIGVSLLIVTYFIRFILKRKKILPDYLKLLFLISFLLSRLFNLQHKSWSYELSLLSVVIFIVLLFYYLHYENQMRKLSQDVDEMLEK